MGEKTATGRCGFAAALPPCGLSRPSASQAKPAAANPVFRRTKSQLRSLPRPRNVAELQALTAWYFGVPLNLARFTFGRSEGSYEIAENYDSYNRSGPQAWRKPTEDGSKPYDNSGYDYSRDFWDHVFGPLYCGGVARASYGQFRSAGGYREAIRLRSLENSWRGRNAGSSSVRTSLARLAPNGGGGESAGSDRSRALTSGRVDAAEAASLECEVRP
jgi:hypothetical protein